MKKLEILLMVLISISFNAVSQHGTVTPALGFTISVSKNCVCDPMIYNQGCVPTTVTLNLVGSQCDSCQGACYEVIICNKRGGCSYLWPGTSAYVQHIDISSYISSLIDYYYLENCFTIKEYISYGCHIIADSNTWDGYVDTTICLYPNPQINLPTSVCAGTYFCNQDDNNYHYQWSGCGYTSGLSDNPCFDFTKPCVYTINVKDSLCTSQWEVTVDSLHPVKVHITGDSVICHGKSVKFTAQPTNGGLTPLYDWRVTGLRRQYGPNNTFTYIPSNTDKVKCILTSSLSSTTPVCATNNPATSNTINMLVHKAVKITDTLPIKICTGDTILFTINARGGTKPYRYEWYRVTTRIWGPTADSTLTPSLADPVDNGFYSYVVLDSNNCNDSISINLNILPKPRVSISPLSDTICIKSMDSVTLSVRGNGRFFDWTPMSSLRVINDSTIRVSPTLTTVYKVMGVNDYNCTTSDTATIYVAKPLDIDSSDIYLLKNAGESVTFTVNSNGTFDYKYQWLKRDTVIPGATKSVYTINSINCLRGDSGVYKCIIINACGSDTAKKFHLYVNCSRFRYSLSGHIKYDDINAISMCDVEVHLANSGDTIIANTITDSTGYYVFVNLVSGTYKLSCSISKEAGGVNPTDALIVNRKYIGMYHFTDSLKERAGDVNSDKKLNPTDALLINRRYIGFLSSYPHSTPDWYFTNYYNKPITSLSSKVTIDGKDTVQNIRAICMGDVNATNRQHYLGGTLPDCFIPMSNVITGNASPIFNPMLLASMTHVSLDTIAGKPNSADTLLMPLRVYNFNNIASFGYKIKFDTTKLKYISLADTNTAIPSGSLISNVKNGVIGIAWTSATSSNINITNQEKLFDLKFVSNGTQGDRDTLTFLQTSVVTNDSLTELPVIYTNGAVHFIYNLSGTLVSNVNCGSKPVPNLALVLKDTNGNINTLIPPAITDSSGRFNFNLNGLHSIDSTKYRIVLLSGIGIADTTARTIPAWNNLNPLSLTLNNVIQDWVENYGNIDTSAYACAIDIHENIYVLCTDMNYGLITLIKYSPLGVREFVVTYGDSTNYNWAYDIKIDKDCFIYLVGVNNTGVVTLKYDSTGYLIWTSNYSPTCINNYNYSQPNLAVNDSGDVYVTGSFYCINSHYGSIFTAKYNSSNGEQLWVNSYGTFLGTTMCIDKFANVYVACGNTLYKFSKAGTFLWSRVYTGGDSIEGIQFAYMKIDTNANLYILGVNHSNTSAIIKFNENGILQWVRVHYNSEYVLSLILDNSANIIITELFSNGGLDLKLIKYNNDGQELYQSNGILNICCPPVSLPNTKVDNDGNIYLSTSLSNDIYYGYNGNQTSVFKFLPDLSEEFEADYFVSDGDAILNFGLIVSSNYNIYTTNMLVASDTTEVTTIKYSQCPESANLLRTIKDKPTPKKSVLSVKDANVNLYPNPNDGSFTLEVSLPADGNVTLQAYNVMGENVLSEQHSMSKGVNKQNLKLNSNSKGIYFFNVVTATKTFNKKVIIE